MTKPQAQFNVLDCDVPLYTVTLWRKSDLTEILGDAFVTSKRLSWEFLDERGCGQKVLFPHQKEIWGNKFW